MRKLLLLLIVAPIFSAGQNSNDSLWGNKQFRSGVTIQTGFFLWKQKNLNSILAQNQLPDTRVFNSSIGLGDILQWNKFRVTALIIFWRSERSKNKEDLVQNFGSGEVNAEYFIVRKKGHSLSPIIGGGFLFGKTQTRRDAIPQTIDGSFVNRNATELFSRQGFIHAGLNFGFDYSPRAKDHIYQLAAGYKYGFSETNWSTDPKREALANSLSDPLRQFYISLKTNIMFYKKVY